MCFCDPNIRTPYCNSLECQEELRRLKKIKKNSRIEIRIKPDVKLKAEKAYLLLGMNSLTEYITKLIEEDAERVITEKSCITVPKDIFDKFLEACENAEPNKELIKAANFSRQKGFID